MIAQPDDLSDIDIWICNVLLLVVSSVGNEFLRFLNFLSKFILWIIGNASIPIMIYSFKICKWRSGAYMRRIWISNVDQQIKLNVCNWMQLITYMSIFFCALQEIFVVVRQQIGKLIWRDLQFFSRVETSAIFDLI